MMIIIIIIITSKAAVAESARSVVADSSVAADSTCWDFKAGVCNKSNCRWLHNPADRPTGDAIRIEKASISN